MAFLILESCGSRSGLPVLELDAGVDADAGASGGTGGVAPKCFTPGELAPERPIGAACAFDGSSTFGVFVASGGRLYGIDGSGTLTTLFEFGKDWPFDATASSTQVVESRGGYVAAAVGATRKGQQNPTAAVVELVLMNASGSVLYHSTRTLAYKGFLDLRLFGNERGVFAFSTQTAAENELEIVGVHGEHYGPLTNALPIADPDSSGRLAVLRDQQNYWLDPCEGSFELVRAELSPEYTSVGVVGSKLTWVDPPSPSAVLETPEGAETLPLALSPKGSLFSTHPSGWQLVSSTFSLWSYATANVATGDAHALEITLPPDVHRFGSFGSGIPGFDNSTGELGQTSDGGVVLGLRDASVGRLYTSLDGLTWSSVGFPVGKVWKLVSIERAGTFLIAGTPLGFTSDDWAPAPPGIERIDYQQMQLVRPPVGVVLVQATPGTGFTRSYSLSADGGCAGTLLDSKLEITSALTLQKSVVTLPEYTPVYGAWTFAPGPNASLGLN
jgi:hypothetical protein